MWIGYEYREISKSDEFIVEYHSRHSHSFQRANVTRVTETSFWLSMDMSLGVKRFTRSMGRMVGDSNYRATPFDKEKWDELVAQRKRTDEQKSQKDRKAELEELERREDFGCAHITDKNAQYLLRELRLFILSSRDNIEGVMKSAGECTIESPWPLYHQFRDSRDHEQFITHVRRADLFVEIHAGLVSTVDEFQRGAEFKFECGGHEQIMSEAAGTSLSALMLAKLRSDLLRLVGNFIQQNRPEIGQREILEALMNVADWKWSSFGFRFNEVKDDV